MPKVYCSHVAVSMSAAVAAATFPEAAFRSHRRVASTNRNKKRGGTRAILRATGDVLIPKSLAGHVDFISGLTELWELDMARSGMGKLDGAGAGGRPGSFAGGMEVGVTRFRLAR